MLLDKEPSDLPRINEITYQMARNSLFSSTDCASGFYSLPLNDDTSSKLSRVNRAKDVSQIIMETAKAGEASIRNIQDADHGSN